jgi:hypothetical protein
LPFDDIATVGSHLQWPNEQPWKGSLPNPGTFSGRTDVLLDELMKTGRDEVFVTNNGLDNTSISVLLSRE